MTQLELFRFDDAYDRYVLVRDPRPMIELLDSPEIGALNEARALAETLARSKARWSEEILSALLTLRRRIELLVSPAL